MKNVAIIIPSLKGGGAERAASRLTLNLSKEKFNIYLFVFDSSGIKYKYNGQLIDINLPESRNVIHKFINFILRISKVRKLKRELDIESSISFLPGPNIVNILSKINEKIIVSVRNNVVDRKKSIYTKILDIMMKFMYNNSDYVIVVSKAIKEDLISVFKIRPEKIKVIYNSYNIDEILIQSLEKIPDEEKKYFSGDNLITIGRLEQIKGQYHLIRAFKDVIDKGFKLNLVIMGEGTLSGYLNNLIVNYKLEKYIHITGFNENPYKYLKNSRVFILPSISEGFPNVLLEAMICGLPVISTDCKTGPIEILAPNSNVHEITSNYRLVDKGILVPPFDGVMYSHTDELTESEKQLSLAIIRILTDEKVNENYANISKEYSKNFNSKNNIKEWEEII